MADLNKMAEELVNLTVKEVNELATILKDEHGIEPAAAAVAVAAGPGAGGDAGGGPGGAGAGCAAAGGVAAGAIVPAAGVVMPGIAGIEWPECA